MQLNQGQTNSHTSFLKFDRKWTGNDDAWQKAARGQIEALQ